MDRANYIQEVYRSLKRRVEADTAGYGFDDWYRDGIDPYLAREAVYRSLEDTDEFFGCISRHTPERVAGAVWDYVRQMDEFPRLWHPDPDVRRVVVLEIIDILKEDNGP